MASRSHYAIQHRSPFPGIELRTVASNHRFPRHAHDQFGIGVIESGRQRSWSAIGQVEAGPGDVIMVNPGEIHDGVPIDSRIREWRMIYFDPPLVAKELAGEGTGTLELVCPVTKDLLLARRFGRLFASLTDCEKDSVSVEENLLLLLVRTAHRYGMARSACYRHAPCLRGVLERLNAAPEIPVTLHELAELCGVSRFRLVRAFACATGVTPHAYLVQRRVELAKQLLARGRTPVQAALQAGFADQSHMTRAFVRQLGVTPSRYQAAVA
jgi:AraC-like DNA-binding protein